MGKLAENTIMTNFEEEVESGLLTFAHVNAQAPENAQLADKYQVTSVSLQIGTYADGGFRKEVDASAWYFLNDEKKFDEHLTGLLRKRLNGELG